MNLDDNPLFIVILIKYPPILMAFPLGTYSKLSTVDNRNHAVDDDDFWEKSA